MTRPQAAFSLNSCIFEELCLSTSRIGPHNGCWRPLHCWKWYLEDEEGNESNLVLIMSKIAICFLSFNHCSIYFWQLSILEIPSITVAVYFFWAPLWPTKTCNIWVDFVAGGDGIASFAQHGDGAGDGAGVGSKTQVDLDVHPPWK